MLQPLVTHSSMSDLFLMQAVNKEERELKLLSIPDGDLITHPPWIKTWLKRLRNGYQRI